MAYIDGLQRPLEQTFGLRRNAPAGLVDKEGLAHFGSTVLLSRG